MKMKHINFYVRFMIRNLIFFRIFHMKGIIFLIFSFHEVKTSPFSLLVWLGSFLQNIRKFGSIATSSKLRKFAQSLFVHKLLLNRLLLICYDQIRNFSEQIWAPTWLRQSYFSSKNDRGLMLIPIILLNTLV